MKHWGIVVSVSREGEDREPTLLSFQAPRVTLGADAGCDVVLPSRSISAEHAHLTLSAGTLTLHDTSRNGTFVGAERIESRVLREGDVVAIGPFRLRFTLVQGGRRKTARWESRGRAFLQVQRGSEAHVGRRYEIGAKGVKIGRSPDADLSFDLLTLSRLHAEVRPRGRGIWVLRDLDSANGVSIGGHRVKEQRLFPGTEFVLGTDLALVFVQEDAEPPKAPAGRT